VETEEPKMFANVGWCYEDVQFHNPNISKEDAEKFLERWEKFISEHIVEHGMGLLERVLIMDKLVPEDL
jgi:hypothetical protein